jgi:hypothetical protein
MKKLTYLLISLAIVLGCSRSDKDEDHSKKNMVFGLPVDSANAFATRYNLVASEILQMPTPIQAFAIRSQDLLQVLGLPVKKTKYPYARIYIGLDSHQNFRAFLVPVEMGDRGYPGKDVIPEGDYQNGWLGESSPNQVAKGKYVFDFTMPCPSSCDTDSPILLPGKDKTTISYKH